MISAGRSAGFAGGTDTAGNVTRRAGGAPLSWSFTGPACAAADRHLFLDDVRLPPEDGRSWVIARDLASARGWVSRHGVPVGISLDHDLGGAETGMVFLRWLIETDLDHPGFLARLTCVDVHSANGPGADNLRGLWASYARQRTDAWSDQGPRFQV